MEEEQYWKVKARPLSGSNYKEVRKEALLVFETLKPNPKRKAYLRSKYFKRKKILFYYFWDHLLEKRMPDRVRRMKLLPCVIELMRDSTFKPEMVTNPQNTGETLYRFYGKTQDKNLFVVQIKKHKSRESLQCISVFPLQK